MPREELDLSVPAAQVDERAVNQDDVTSRLNARLVRTRDNGRSGCRWRMLFKCKSLIDLLVSQSLSLLVEIRYPDFEGPAGLIATLNVVEARQCAAGRTTPIALSIATLSAA